MGNVSLVIGGTSGIGAEVVKLLRLQHRTVLAEDEKSCDVRSCNQIERLLKNLDEDGDTVTEMVYCAGINDLEWIGKLGHNEYDRVMDVFDVNVVGFIRWMDSLVEWQGNQTPVNVVAISSDAATRPLRTSISYCASKSALEMAVRVASRELAPKGWRVNAVAPGMVSDTGMTAYVDRRVPEVRGWASSMAQDYERSQEVVHGRISPVDVANLVTATLAGPAHQTGSVITINGGR